MRPSKLPHIARPQRMRERERERWREEEGNTDGLTDRLPTLSKNIVQTGVHEVAEKTDV